MQNYLKELFYLMDTIVPECVSNATILGYTVNSKLYAYYSARTLPRV